MDFGAKPIATAPGSTQASILAEQMALLREQRSRMKEENAAYLSKHPELKTLLDEFMIAALTAKPPDVVKFAAIFFTQMKDPNIISGPMPLIVTGASGAGRTTIVTKLLEMFPDIFQAPLMHTSRAPRAGEENGVHYNFVQKSDIEGGISRGEYIHYHQEKNSYFALKISTIDAIRKGGRIALVDLDMADVKLVKQSMMVVKTIFISPPSLPALDLRLKALAIEPLPKIQARMLTAKIEMDAAHADEQIDKIVTNDNVEQCCNRIVYQLDGWYPDFNFHENETGEDDH